MELGIVQMGYEVALAFLSLYLGVNVILMYRKTEGFPSLRWFGAAFFVFAVSTSLTATGLYLRVVAGQQSTGTAINYSSNLLLIIAFFAYCAGVQQYIRSFSGLYYINAAYLLLALGVYGISASALVGRYAISIYIVINICLILFHRKSGLSGALNSILGGLLTAVVIFTLIEPVTGLFQAFFGSNVPFQAYFYYGLSILFFMQIGLGVFRLVAQVQADRLEALATTDTLTGMLNRRTMSEVGEREVLRARRYDLPLTAMMVDLDHFKKVNDTYGHAAGDLVLKKTAETIRASVRRTDFLIRYGGEEFLLLLIETDVNQAATLADKLRKKISQTRFEGYDDLSMSASIGLALFAEDETFTQLTARADMALYQAKEQGRNRTVIHRSN